MSLARSLDRIAHALTRPGWARRLATLLGTATAANVAMTGAAFVLHVALARLLGAAHYGVYAWVVTWANLVALAAKVGFDTSIVRFFAAYASDRAWGSIRGFRRRAVQIGLASAVGLGLTGAGLVRLVGGHLEPGLETPLLVGCALLPLIALTGIEQAGLRGLGQVARGQVPLGVVRPLTMIALVTASVAVLEVPVDGARALALDGVALAVALLIARAWLGRALPDEVGASEPRFETRRWLTVSLPLLLVSGLRLLLNQIDIILLGLLVGTTEAGLYAVAARVSRFVAFGLKIGNMSSQPLMAEYHHAGRRHELQRTVTVSAWAASAAALAIAIALVAASRFFLGLFGPEFTTAGRVLTILVLGQLVNASTGPVEHLLSMTGEERQIARISTWIATLNALFSVPAILAWGMDGAAIVTSSLIAGKNLWAWLVAWRRLGVNSSIFSLRRPPA